MPLRSTLIEIIEEELMRIAAHEPMMPRELYLHPFEFGEVLRTAGEWGSSRFGFRQEYTVPPLPRSVPLGSQSYRVENITTFLGVTLRSDRYVAVGSMIALYTDRRPAVEVYRFNKSLGVFGEPSAPTGSGKSLWARLREGGKSQRLK